MIKMNSTKLLMSKIHLFVSGLQHDLSSSLGAQNPNWKCDVQVDLVEKRCQTKIMFTFGFLKT